MRYGLKLILSVGTVGLLLYWAFDAHAPKSGSGSENSVIAPPDSNSALPSKYALSSLSSVVKGDVVAEQYGAVICPDSKTEDAFSSASLRTAANPPSDSISEPDLAAIWLNTAKSNGCDYIRPGASLVSEGEISNSDQSRPMASVTAKMSDGITIKGVAFSNMLYSVPKGNVVAANFGAIICPDSEAIIEYKNASTAWIDKNKSNMNAEEYRVAAKSAIETLADFANVSIALFAGVGRRNRRRSWVRSKLEHNRHGTNA